MRRSFDLGLKAALLAGVAMAAPAPMAFAQSADGAETSDDAIVVTARRREERLQDVPLSVAVASGEELEARSIENLEELGQTTPNFHFAEQPNGGRMSGVAFIRGVGQRDANSAYDPAVGIYVDGVYMGRAYGSNLDFMDVARVEVLRGPQGTLFGKNASGGVINIISERPDVDADTVSARFQASLGSYNRLDLGASINIPLADRAALRISAASNDRDGFGDRIDGQEMADANRTNVRAQFRLEASEHFTIDLAADSFEFDEKNAAYRLVDVNPAVATVAAYNGARDPDYNDSWVSAPFFSNGTGPNASAGDIWGVSATLTYDWSGATLRSITAYRELQLINQMDIDGSPINFLDKLESLEQNQFSQEFQLTGSSFNDRFDWVLGVYYFDESIVNPTSFPVIFDLFGFTRSFTRTYDVENEALAIYGQGSFAITDRLNLTAGVRATRDEKRVHVTQVNYPAGNVLLFPAQNGEFTSEVLLPRLGLDYHWSDDLMTFVSVAAGSRNGGFNGQAARPTDFTSFDDETVWTYEVGLRSDFWNARMRLNATIFYSDYRDLQLQINGSTIVSGSPLPFNIITNVPEAHIQGAEIDLTLRPTDNLLLTAGLGLTEGAYDELPTDAQFIASSLITLDSKMSNMPEQSWSIGAEQTFNFGGGYDLIVRADYAYRSRIYYNQENTANVTQPGYGLLNARLTLETPSGFSLSLWGTNLTDEEYIIGGYDDAITPNPGLGFSFAMMGPPREVGVSAAFRF